MTKNEYYFEFLQLIENKVDEKSFRKNRMSIASFFQGVWTPSIQVSPTELAYQAITELKLKSKKREGK